MSIQAHRIDRLDYGPTTFKPLEDGRFMDWLELNSFGPVYDALPGGTGRLDISVEVLETALVEFTDMNPELRKAIERDIAWAATNGAQYVMYDCF